MTNTWADPYLTSSLACLSSSAPALQTLTLSQYQEAFIAAAVDGAFLYDLNDDDLKSSLGVEHRLHRKKILNSINRLKAAEVERVRPVALNSVSLHVMSCPPQTGSTYVANRDPSPLQNRLVPNEMAAVLGAFTLHRPVFGKVPSPSFTLIFHPLSPVVSVFVWTRASFS